MSSWLRIAIVFATVTSFSVTVRADVGNARALIAEGEGYEESGRTLLALERFEQAIQEEPTYSPGYQRAIPLWLRLGKLEHAQNALESLTVQCEDCVFAWYSLAGIYRKTKRFDLAVSTYEVYLAKRPGDADALFGLAMALHATGETRIVSILRRYLRVERRHERNAYRARIRRLLAEVCAKRRYQSECRNDRPMPSEVAPTDVKEVEELIERGRFISAESLLGQGAWPRSTELRVRAQISAKRGQWGQRILQLALAWLWR